VFAGLRGDLAHHFPRDALDRDLPVKLDEAAQLWG
jgi:hypothetical protein